MIKDFFRYLQHLFFHRAVGSVLLGLDVIGWIAIYYRPDWLAAISTVNFITVLAFAIAGYKQHREQQSRIESLQSVIDTYEDVRANIRLQIERQHFGPSHGSVSSPWPDVRRSERGFSEQGLPDWGSLYARIRAANVGGEPGKLIWELDEAKTRLPALFNRARTEVTFLLPGWLEGGQPPRYADFTLFIPLREQQPERFAEALKDLVESKAHYEVVMAYRTERVDGESGTHWLGIEGDFDDFYRGVLRHWQGYGFKDLVTLARLEHPQ